MGLLVTGVTRPEGLVLAAASAATAATLDMIESSRDATDIAGDLRQREVAENIADALQSVCSIELEDDTLPADRRAALGELLAATSRFVEGWA